MRSHLTKQVLAWDTETALIRSGRAAPELANVSFADSEGNTGLIHWTEARPFFEAILRDPDLTLVGHNVAFDMAVVCSNFPDLVSDVFAAYEAGRVRCTMLRQQLLDIGAGVFRGYLDSTTGEWRKYDYDLAALVRRAGLPYELHKDTWRLTYGQLRDLPLDQWPAGAKEYSLMDALATRDVFLTQGTEYIPDEIDEAYSFFCLQLASVWGLRTDPERVRLLEEETKDRLEEVRQNLIDHGLVREDGSRDTKAASARIEAAWKALGQEPRKTKTGRMQLDEESCGASEDDVLSDYAAYSTLLKLLSNDIELLTAAAVLPIHPGFKLLETCRIGTRRQQGMAGGSTQNIARSNRRKCPTCKGRNGGSILEQG